MTDRTVKVSLILQAQGYMQGMRQAADETDKVGSKAEKLAQQRASFETLGRSAVGFGAAVALGVGVAISKWAEFDQQMSYVQAATHETAANMGLLRDAALEAGARTVFSATEAAGAIEELARAGVKTQDILGGGLDAALDLAAAGGLQVADAAGIAAVALKTFNLRGEDMSHVSDLLAAGAGKAMGDVSQLSQALAQGGQVARQTGLSIEETTAGLAAFAAQGLLGSDAGTSFKSMLQRLTPQSNEAKQKMQELGISAYDAAGNFVGLAQFAGNLQHALRGLTKEQYSAAMSTIFGSDAVRAAGILYDEGEKGIRDWISAVDDQGYAAETAAMRLDNLKGDWEAFTGALDTAMITMGEGADGPLRDLVQGLTSLVDGFNDLPDPAQQAVLWVGLVTAGVALAGGTALIAVPKIAAFQVGLQTLGITGATTRAGLARFATFLTGPWGVALAAAVTAVVALQSAQDALRTSSEEFQNVIKNAKSVDDLFDAADSAVPWLSRLKEATADVETFQSKLDIIANNDFMRGLDRSTSQLANSLRDMGKEFANVADSDLPAAQRAFQMLATEYDLQGEQLQWLLNAMPEYKTALQKVADQQGINFTTGTEAENAQALLNLAMGDGVDASVALQAELDATAASTEEAATAAQEAKDAFNAMKDALDGIAATAMSMGEATDAALSAIHAMTDAAEVEGATIDGTNDASIKLRRSVREVEQAHRDAAAAIIENGGTLADAQAEYDKSRAAIIEMLKAKGMDADQAAIWAEAQLGSAEEVKGGIEALYRAWLDLPENKETKYRVEAEEAAQKLADLKARLDAIPNSKYTKVTLETVNVGGRTISAPGSATGNIFESGRKVTSFASGGTTGPVGYAAGIYPPVPGGLLKFAEAGWSESIISMNPAYRDRSLDIWAETGRRLGAFQPLPASSSTAKTKSSGVVFKFGDVYGADEAEISRNIDQLWRQRLAVSGTLEEIGD